MIYVRNAADYHRSSSLPEHATYRLRITRPQQLRLFAIIPEDEGMCALVSVNVLSYTHDAKQNKLQVTLMH